MICAETRDLTKVFADRQVLRVVNLKLRAGAIHALLGANGSGKSTAVKLLTGVYQPDGGTIVIGGREFRAIGSPHVASALGVAVVHQEAPLIDSFSVAECIAQFRGYPTRAGRIHWARLNRDVRAMLERFDLPIDPARARSSSNWLGRRLTERPLASGATHDDGNERVADAPAELLAAKQRAALSTVTGTLFKRYTTLMIVIALVIVFPFLSPQFLTSLNLKNLLVVQVTVCCMAFAAILPLIVGEFDLSLGYALGFIMMLGAFLGYRSRHARRRRRGRRPERTAAHHVQYQLLHRDARVGIVLSGVTQGMSGGSVLYSGSR
jgi:ABC-type Fe3+/spermidine/putrescine transport system ATPase subunit